MTSAVAAAREQSLQELDRELAEIARTYPARQVSIVVRKAALEALRRVVKRTPVLKGRARANWQLTIGAPAEGEVTRLDADGATTIAAGTATLGALAQAAPNSYPVVWITNNLPYILVLEEGGYPPNPEKGTYMPERRTRSGRRVKAHYEIRSAGGYSKQAPRGMVAVTVEELLQQFNRLEAQA